MGWLHGEPGLGVPPPLIGHPPKWPPLIGSEPPVPGPWAGDPAVPYLLAMINECECGPSVNTELHWTLECDQMSGEQRGRERGNNGVRKYIRPSSHWAFMMLLELGLQHNWLCKSVKIASSNTSCWIKFWNYFGSKFPMAWRALRIWIWSKVLWGKWLKFCLPRKVS